MKKITLSIVLFGLCFSLSAQDKAFRNSLSLNFVSAFTNIGVSMPVNPPARMMFPGLEYRYEYGERLSLRAGLDYRPQITYRLEVDGTEDFSQTSVRGLNLSSGVQYRFWGDDFSQDFRMYAFGDLILGRQWVENQGSFQVFTGDTLVQHVETLSVHASLSWGVGVEYIPISRLVIRAEAGLSGGVVLHQWIDRVEDEQTEIGFFPQGADPRFLINGNLFTELSIGWRF
ncbi:MAG: hypothetical protein AAFP02_03175 [Bacteroidota bacterium]